jgi:anti-sigma B factor antagonist
MEINLFYEDGILDIHIHGELDANSSIELDEVIKNALKEGKTRIVVNCHHLRYISSAGLGVFISHLDDLSRQNGRFIFCNMNDSVLQVFKILGLTDIMTITDNEAKAKTMMRNES